MLPIPDRTFGGAIGRTLRGLGGRLDDDPGPEGAGGRPERADRASSTTRGTAPRTRSAARSAPPNLTRVQQMGLTYNRFHVTAVCSPTRAALLTGRNQHRVGFGSVAEYPGPVPRLHRAQAEELRGVAPDPARRTVMSPAASASGTSPRTTSRVRPGPFDHWPKSWGFDHWWGFLSGAAGQYDPIITQDDAVIGRARGQGRQAVLLPRRHHRQGDRVAPCGPRAGRRPSRG